MGLNINAGSLRDPVEWYKQPDGADDDGNPVPKIKQYKPVMANVRYSSGEQLAAIGAATTSEIITVLTWYDSRIDNSFFIRFNNLYYEIQHIKPDELRKGMLITAEVQRDG